MKKEELKTGMVVTHRNGIRSVVMRDCFDGSDKLIDLYDGCFISLSSVADGLTTPFSSAWDITKVERHGELSFLFRDVFAKSLERHYPCMRGRAPRLLWKRDDPKKAKLETLINDLQKQIKDAKEKLKEFD